MTFTPNLSAESMASYHKFFIEIDIDDRAEWTAEVASILHRIRDQLLDPRLSRAVKKSPASRLSFHLRDSNGDSVGKWEVLREEFE